MTLRGIVREGLHAGVIAPSSNSQQRPDGRCGTLATEAKRNCLFPGPLGSMAWNLSRNRIRRLTRGATWYTLWHMKTVTIRQIHHDFGAVLALVAQGEEVTVLNRTRPVARICPPRPEAPAKFKMPDFAARAKAIFGDSKLMPNIVLEEREERQW